MVAPGYQASRYGHLAALLLTFFVMSPSAVANQSTNRSELHAEVLLKLEQGRYTLEFHDVARRQVAADLFAAIGAEIIWLNRAQANQHIAGRHIGSLEAIANKLLSNLNHTIVYDMTGEKPRVSKVIVFGPEDREDAMSISVLSVSANNLAVSTEDDLPLNEAICWGNRKTDMTTGVARGASGFSVSDKALSVDAENLRWISLDDGRLLTIEGTGCVDNEAGSPEIYNPVTGDVTITGAMAVKRTGYASHQLPDGDVLVFGGDISGEFSETTELVERFDLASGTWSIAGHLSSRKRDMASCPLADGTILLVGSPVQGASDKLGSFVSAEFFDPATGLTRSPSSKPNFDHKGALVGAALEDGRCFIASEGPELRVELFDPATDTFSTVPPPLGWKYVPTIALSTSALPDGTLLYIGSTAMVFEPKANSFRLVP